MICVGIDPGKSSGCIAVIDAGVVECLRLKDKTDFNIHSFLRRIASVAERDGKRLVCVIENLHAMHHNRHGAKQGSGMTTAWSLSGSYHGLKMALTCNEIDYSEVSPITWQNYLNSRTGGDKRISQARARQLFPGHDCYQWQADAMLLAKYAEIYLADGQDDCYDPGGKVCGEDGT